ncbi:MAG: family 43 glycosylhydrolase [Chitinophagaceae bacterium]
MLLLSNTISFSQKKSTSAIYSGVPWFDDQGNVVSAHGANIIQDKDRFYLFGERHTDTSNAFAGINCYSSADLSNWKFESIALPVQESGKLGPNRVGERPKVMKCPATGEYVMYLHVDTLGYKDQFVGYATASRITGPYTFKGPLLIDGRPIKKWDMGTFQDLDGAGYVLLHGGDIYKLGDDYKSITEQTNKAMERGFESPAMFHKNSLYYFLGSDLTGWERNDNYYFTASSLKGPWTRQGIFAPKGSLTWNSQTSFVLPIQGSKVYMFMGDRWSFPKQASAATYIWQPLTISGHSLSIPAFREAWKINWANGEVSPAVVGGKTIEADDKQIAWSGDWQQDTLTAKRSDKKGASFSVTVRGTQVGFYALARPDGGYALITLRNSKGKIVVSSTVDMYSKFPELSLKFLSPVFPKDNYTLTVSVLAENWYWVSKNGSRSGSTGYLVSLNKIVVND